MLITPRIEWSSSVVPDAYLPVASAGCTSPPRRPLFADGLTIAKAIIAVNRLNDNYGRKSDKFMIVKVIFFYLEERESEKM
ncbi:hypothetical protein [Atlantibacter hermannii]|uniref:hypothetical protein n=1 Tax=Atlantibacter hermannii TaxID=565 RepID=UPI002FDF1CF9